MFLYNGKEYYPLEISQIIGRDGKTVYDRDKRGKSYFYLDLETKENEGDE